MSWAFSIEKSGASKCRECGKAFADGDLRLGITLSVSGQSASTQYRHIACATKPQARELLNTKASWSDANFKGWGKLDADTRAAVTDELEKTVEAGSAEKKPKKAAAKGKGKGKGKKSEGAGSKRKKKADDDEEGGDDDDEDDGKKKKKAKKEKKEKDKDAPKKPLTSYMQFSQEKRAEHNANTPKKADGKPEKAFDMKAVAEQWKALTADEKKVYEDRYKSGMEQWKKDMEEYTKKKEGGASAAAADADGDAAMGKEADKEEAAPAAAEGDKADDAVDAAAAADADAEEAPLPTKKKGGKLKKMADAEEPAADE